MRFAKDSQTLFPAFASLTVALWTVLLFYAVSEAAMRGSLIWLAFLLGAIAVPERTSRVLRHAVFDNADGVERVSFPPLEMTTGQQR